MSRYDNVVASDLFFVNPNTGKAELRLHPGQVKAWDSEKRFVTVLAGTQSGKLLGVLGGCGEKSNGEAPEIILPLQPPSHF